MSGFKVPLKCSGVCGRAGGFLRWSLASWIPQAAGQRDMRVPLITNIKLASPFILACWALEQTLYLLLFSFLSHPCCFPLLRNPPYSFPCNLFSLPFFTSSIAARCFSSNSRIESSCWCHETLSFPDPKGVGSEIPSIGVVRCVIFFLFLRCCLIISEKPP